MADQTPRNDFFMLHRELEEISLVDRLHAGENVDYFAMGAHLHIGRRSSSPTSSQHSGSTMSLRSHPQKHSVPSRAILSIVQEEVPNESGRTSAGSTAAAFEHPASIAGSNDSSTRAQCPTNSQAPNRASSNTESTGESTVSTRSSMPPLTRESSSSSSSSSPLSVATADGIEDLPTHIAHLDPTTSDGDVAEITNNPPTNIVFERPEPEPLECLLWWLNNCGCEQYTTWDEKEMYTHSLEHHFWSKEQGRPLLPPKAICPLADCKKLFSTTDAHPDFAWKALLKHMAKHHRDGHTLQGSVLDNELLEFLRRSKLINDPQYQDIFQNGQLTQPFNHYIVYHNEEQRRRRAGPLHRRPRLPPSSRHL